MRRIAHIHPDYSLGRNVFDHFSVAMAKLRAQVVSESWPKLGSTVFTADVAKTMAATPDLVVTSVWGGDYVILYRQALAAGMFSKTKLATAMAFGVTPHAIGRDHPEGAHRARGEAETAVGVRPVSRARHRQPGVSRAPAAPDAGGRRPSRGRSPAT